MKRILSAAFALTAAVFVATCAWADENDAQPLPDGVVAREFVFDAAPFASCHAATIAETPSGALVCAWFAGTREGAQDVEIWAARREKDSDAWSAPEVVGRADEGMAPCWNPVLFQQTDGPLWLFYKQAPRIKDWQGVLVRSEDEGKTWNERKLLPEGFLGPIKNKPVALKDGSILCPSSSEHDGWRVHFESIPDFDKTWSRTQAINSREECGAIQPTILIHKDGRLQALCRNRDGNGKILQTRSDDAGRTWSKLTPTALPNPCSGIDAVFLKDGRHLLVYNHTTTKTGGRNVLNVAISDDGENWRALCVLENSRGEFSYPAVIQTRDGLVHIVYTWKRVKIRHVVMDPSQLVGKPIVDGVWPTGE